MTQPGAGRSRPAWSLIAGAALLQAALHAASIGRYGIFRDELYYLSCASRPAAGYVDQPAFSILFLAAWRALFGDSPAALMVPPAVCGAAIVVLTGLLARRFGGGATAQGLAALAAAVAPIWLGMTGYYSMNAFDILLWTVAASLLAKILEGDFETASRGGVGRLWLLLGCVLALGLLNKVSVLWLGAGIAAGLVLTPARRWLTTLVPWLAGGGSHSSASFRTSSGTPSIAGRRWSLCGARRRKNTSRPRLSRSRRTCSCFSTLWRRPSGLRGSSGSSRLGTGSVSASSASSS